MNVYIRAPTGREVSWGSILFPLAPSLWVATTLTALGVATLLTALCRYGDADDAMPFNDAVLFVFGAVFCLQGYPRSPRAMSCRIVHFLPYVIGVVVLSSYSAVLTSVLTVSRPRMPFTSLEGIRADGTYGFGVARNSAAQKMLEKSQDSVLRFLYNTNNLQRNAPESNFLGMQKVCDSKYAFIAPNQVVDMVAPFLSCRVAKLPDYFTHSPASYALLHKSNAFKGILNHNLLKLREDGVLKHAMMSFINQDNPNHEKTSIATNLEAALPILVVVLSGTLLACSLLLMETLIHYLLLNKVKLNGQTCLQSNFRKANFKLH